jgi:hypothetical protein
MKEIFIAVDIFPTPTELRPLLHLGGILSAFFSIRLFLYIVHQDADRAAELERDYLYFPNLSLTFCSTMHLAIAMALSHCRADAVSYLFYASPEPRNFGTSTSKHIIADITQLLHDPTKCLSIMIDAIGYDRRPSLLQPSSTPRSFWICSHCLQLFQSKVTSCANCKGAG